MEEVFHPDSNSSDDEIWNIKSPARNVHLHIEQYPSAPSNDIHGNNAPTHNNAPIFNASIFNASINHE